MHDINLNDVGKMPLQRTDPGIQSLPGNSSRGQQSKTMCLSYCVVCVYWKHVFPSRPLRTVLEAAELTAGQLLALAELDCGGGARGRAGCHDSVLPCGSMPEGKCIWRGSGDLGLSSTGYVRARALPIIPQCGRFKYVPLNECFKQLRSRLYCPKQVSQCWIASCSEPCLPSFHQGN